MPAPKRRRRGSRYAVLGMLSMGLKTGYAMKKHVEGNLGHYWSESYGQIYPILRQLVDEGLATCTEERRRGKPMRNLYSITPPGRKELRAWLAMPPEPQPQRSELLLKLSLGNRVSSKTCQKLIGDHREQCKQDLRYLGDIESALCGPGAHHRDQPYWLMTLRHGQAIREAELVWCGQTLTHLRRLAAQKKKTKEGGVPNG
jgi:PadR family transcriptional regulator AphA